MVVGVVVSLRLEILGHGGQVIRLHLYHNWCQSLGTLYKGPFNDVYAYLHKKVPDFVEYDPVHVVLRPLQCLGIQVRCLARNLGEYPNLLLIHHLLLQEHFRSLGEHDLNQGLDGVAAQVGRWRVEEVLVDVGEHAGGCLEGVVGHLQPGILGAVLGGGVAGEDGGDVEDDGGLFEGEGELRRGLVGEGVEPAQLELVPHEVRYWQLRNMQIGGQGSKRTM